MRIGIILLTAAALIGLGVLSDAVAVLLVGWFTFLQRNLPLVTVNASGVLSGLVVIGLTLVLVHIVAGTRRVPATLWRFRYSLYVLLAIVLMFAVGLSTIGLARHVGWLFSSPEPIFHSVPIYQQKWID
jgi:hypothetical protein